MTIRDMDKFISQLWDWGFLNGCFKGTGIRVSDLDGIVESRGRFLVLEGKSGTAPIPTGQAIMFNAMIRTNAEVGYDLFTVLVMWGEGKPARMTVWPQMPPVPCDESDIQRFVEAWFQDTRQTLRTRGLHVQAQRREAS